MAVTLNANTSTGFIATSDTSGVLQLQTGGTAAVTVDASQNVGLGVTPSAWQSSGKAFEVAQASLFSRSSITAVVATNAYYNTAGNWIYSVSSRQSSHYEQFQGQHAWYTAPAGTAGNTISFTQAMTLDAAGNLGVGTTSIGNKFVVSNSGAAGLEIAPTLRDGESVGSFILSYNRSGAAYIPLQYDASYHAWLTSNTERARIDSSGNFMVGTTSAYLTSRLSIESANTNNLKLTQNVYNSAATSTSKASNTIVRIASNANGADACVQVTDSVANNYFFGGNNAGAYVMTNTNGVRLSNGGTSWASDSDERVKDIIEPITDAAEKVSSLRAVIGRYKTDAEDKRRAFLIAQDVQAVLPEAVFDEQGTLMLAYTETIPLLVAAIKEQQAIIQTLTDRITVLEGTTP